MDIFEAVLKRRESEGNLREVISNPGLIDFCSNDYLGLARSAKMRAAFNLRIKDKNSGSSGARLISGNYQELEELEDAIARYHNSESTLLFPTGYMANLGLYSAIGRRGDTILYDEFCHTSIKDGIRLGFARAYPFKHNDLDDLVAKIRRAGKGQLYVAVEALYSMDGDFAPLLELAAVCGEMGGRLIVDEAHSGGVFGEKGEGLVSHLGLEGNSFARVVTFGKAFGCQGGAVVGSSMLRQYLINFSRPFIYSTAMSPLQCAFIAAAYDLIGAMQAERTALFQNIQFFGSQIEEARPGPIQIIKIPGNQEAKECSQRLAQAGFDVRAVLSPTVRLGEERLRICLHAYNSQDEIYAMLRAAG